MNIQGYQNLVSPSFFPRKSESKPLQNQEILPEKQENSLRNGGEQYSISEEAQKFQEIEGDSAESLPEEEEQPKYQLTDKEREKLEKLYQKLNDQWAVKDMAILMAESSKSQGEAQAEYLQEQSETMKKCMNIARNLGKGLRISPADEQYLMEKNVSMYQLATTARMLAEKLDKRAKSELDEEDLAELRGESTVEDESPASPVDDRPNREKYAEIPMMEAIGDILAGNQPLAGSAFQGKV